MKNLSIGNRVGIIIFLIFLICMAINHLILNVYLNENTKEVYLDLAKSLQEDINFKLSAKKKVGITNAISISNDERIKDALLSNNRQKAYESLSHVNESMKKFTPFKNTKVHVHTKDNISFIRSWNKTKHSDNLSSFRHTVVEVNKNKTALSSFEVGKAGLSLRSIVPIFKNSKHIGSLEFMQGLNSVAKSFEKNEKTFFLLARKDKLNSNTQSISIDKYIVSQKFVNNEVLKDLKNINFEELLKQKYILSEKYFYTYVNINDFRSNNLGIALAAIKIEKMNKTIDHASFLIYLALAVMTISALIIYITIVITLKKTIINPLGKFQDGLLAFFAYLNGKSNKVEVLDFKNNDEIGQMSLIVNENMQSIKKGLEADEKVIDEVKDIVEKVNNGFYFYQIKNIANNSHVEDLKQEINKMIKDTSAQFDLITTALQHYGESRFNYEIENTDTLNGSFGTLYASTRLIGNNVSELLAMIINSGEKLDVDTSILSDSSKDLSGAATQQAASLEETAAALEEITSTITNNTANVEKMNYLAKEVTLSVQEGQKLANNTTSAMDEINEQVSSINEAITVIDQIAFQTNILSLNAAVEAATAGEAGKGFAVVAQEVRNLASRSAEAAKEIKVLVENANLKANDGKKIANSMIHGYSNLNSKINETIELIDGVSSSSKEQAQGITQINDAVSQLDQATQENALASSRIYKLSEEISFLSNDLVNAASKAEYTYEARKQISDVDLVFKTAKLKNDHINFKETNFKMLGDNKYWQVTNEKQCDLGKWINEQERLGSDFTRSKNWEELKKYHEGVHQGVQRYIVSDSKKENNEILKKISKEIESATLGVFDGLNKVKIEHSNHLNSTKNIKH